MHDTQILWSAPAEKKTEQQLQRAASRQSGDGAFVREAQCQRGRKRARRFEQHGRRFALRTASLAPALRKLHRLTGCRLARARPSTSALDARHPLPSFHATATFNPTQT